MKLTASIVLLFFVTIVTGQIEDFDLDLYETCMKDNPTVLNDILSKHSHDIYFIEENNDNVNKLFECELLAYHMVKPDKTLDFKKLGPVFQTLIRNGKYLKSHFGFDELYETCTAVSLDKSSIGGTFVKLNNCIVKKSL